MSDIRAPDIKELAKQDYLKGMKYKDLAEKYNVSLNTIKSWIKRYEWSKEKNVEGAHKSKRGAPLNNKNAVGNKGGGAPLGNKNAVGNSGGAAPKGNLNSLKHGAYQTLYEDMLSDEEKELYEKTTADINIDSEIRLLRLKIARLLNRDKTFFYDMFGKRHNKEVSEEDRENGILACMDQLRRLIETKATIAGDSEKLAIEREKLEFSKYKTEVELQLKREKLELEKSKLNGNDNDKDREGINDFINATTMSEEDIKELFKDDTDEQEE